MARREPPSNYSVHWVSFTVDRRAVPSLDNRQLLNNPAPVAELARALIPDDGREHFLAFYVDPQNRLVASYEVSAGTVNGTLVHPRDVIGPALRLLGVDGVIAAHNHPSGEVTPSQTDTELTRTLVQAAKLFPVRVLDHVIVAHGETAFASLAERGLMEG